MVDISKAQYLNFLRRILNEVLTKRTKIVIAFLPVVAVVAALFEVASVGLLVPFIHSLTNPDFLKSIDEISAVMLFFGLSDTDLVFYVQATFLLFIIFSGAARIICNRILLFANARIGSELANHGVKKLLHTDYETHTYKDSSAAITALTRKIDEVLDLTITPILMLVTSGITLAMIIGFLAWAAPEISAFIFISICGIYVSVSYVTTRMLKKFSIIQASASVSVMGYLKEMMSGFREIKLKDLSKKYAQDHFEADQRFRRSQASIRFYSQSPKYVVETAILLIAFVLTIALMEEGTLITSSPTLIMIALGLQKALPYAQVLYSSFSLLEGGKASGMDVIDALHGSGEPVPEVLEGSERNLDFEMIQLVDLSFRYKATQVTILENLNLMIEAGDRVGIVGGSGTGKSTFSDLFMGLIEPTHGSLLINGFIPDAQTLRAWQAKIAHVPQDLFIQNSSLAENVAFGRPKNEIDVTRVSEVLEEVGLTDFVMNLPHGVWSHLGEDGGATSGGQRQRICLARALYDPDVQILVLDEPTSALNTELEDEIIRLIFSVKKIKVVIIVTHNRDILKYCNKTMDLDNKNRMFHV